MDDDLVLGHLQELRRGTVVVACLAALGEPMYGYRLIEDLAAAGITVGADTLYPLLRRLENQGLLTSEWSLGETRPRKFYATTDTGRAVLQALVAEWRSLDSALTAVLDPAAPADLADPQHPETAEPPTTNTGHTDPENPAATEKP